MKNLLSNIKNKNTKNKKKKKESPDPSFRERRIMAVFPAFNDPSENTGRHYWI